MTSSSAWKPAPDRPTPRPPSGPDSQAGHPPLRAGTNWEGADAAPALSSSTHVTTPISPTAPSAWTTPAGAREPVPPPARAPARRAPAAEEIGVAACMHHILASGRERGVRLPRRPRLSPDAGVPHGR
jgi:hypothetical protein